MKRYSFYHIFRVDYEIGINSFARYCDYLVVNVSSPNTPNLRSLQTKADLKNVSIIYMPPCIVTKLLRSLQQYLFSFFFIRNMCLMHWNWNLVRRFCWKFHPISQIPRARILRRYHFPSSWLSHLSLTISDSRWSEVWSWCVDSFQHHSISAWFSC